VSSPLRLWFGSSFIVLVVFTYNLEQEMKLMMNPKMRKTEWLHAMLQRNGASQMLLLVWVSSTTIVICISPILDVDEEPDDDSYDVLMMHNKKNRLICLPNPDSLQNHDSI
jgi:hypothetical protein